MIDQTQGDNSSQYDITKSGPVIARLQQHQQVAQLIINACNTDLLTVNQGKLNEVFEQEMSK